MRHSLGRGILLGLEVLVGADIIAFLSASLEIEIEGKPPWR